MIAKSIITALLILGITGCSTTTYVSPELPDFAIAVPERPTLERVDEEVPKGATNNLISMIGYSEKLEAIIDGWELFYSEIKEIYSNAFSDT